MVLRLVIFSILLGAILSAPVDERGAKIIQEENKPNTGDGSYSFRYETSNGISRNEKGELKKGKDNKDYLFVSGFYEYDSDKGRIRVNYEAGEEGYKQQEQGQINVRFLTPQILQLPSATIASLVGGGLG